MITAYDDEFSVDYSGHSLKDIFLFQPASNVEESFDQVLNFDDDILQVGTQRRWLERLKHAKPASLLLASALLSDQETIQFLQTLADQGCQIFLLLGDDQQNIKAIEALSGRCCIRTGVLQSGMLIITEPTVKNSRFGLICSSGFSSLDDFGYSLELESRQVDDYYRLFCRLFWKQAQYEYLEQGQKQLCAAPPITNIDLEHEHVFPEQLTTHVNNALNTQGTIVTNSHHQPEKLWQLFNTQPLNLSDSQLLISLQQVSSAHLRTLTNKPESLTLLDRRLPQLILTRGDNWLFPFECQPESNIWGIKLTENQVQSLTDYQFELQQSERWLFTPEITVGELNTPLRHLDQIKVPVKYAPKKTVSLGELECENFEDFEKLTASELAERKGLTHFKQNDLAKTIQYHVVITPPALPKGAKKDPLYKHWNDTQSSWLSKVKDLEDHHHQMQKEQQNIRESLYSFMSSFLTGRLNTARKTEKILKEKKGITLAPLSPATRQEQLNSLNQLADQLMSEDEKFAQELDKAKQLKEWEETYKKLIRKNETAQEQKSSSELALKEFQKSEPSKRQSAMADLDASWQDWLTFIKEQELTPKIELPASTAAISNWIASNLDNIKDIFAPQEKPHNQKLIDDWDKFLDKFGNNDQLKKEIDQLKALDIQGINDWLQSPTVKPSKKMKPAMKELQALCATNKTSNLQEVRNRLVKMQKAFEQTTKSLEHEGENLKKSLNTDTSRWQNTQEALAEHNRKKGSIKPQDSKGVLAKLFGASNKLQSSDFTLAFPDEDLPEIGTLFHTNGQRYLAILQQEEIEQAKDTAMRLNARLVVGE